MKTAAIFHGYGESPNSYWFPYAKKELEKKGYEVWTPQLPNADKPDYQEQTQFVLDNFKFSNRSVLIGHSAGSPLTLSVLQNLDIKIAQAILVSGFITPLEADGPNSILQDKYDWDKIRNNVDDIIFVHSDNDPWKCDDKEGRKMFDKLGGTLIIRHGEGHMGSTQYNQPYDEFPFLIKLVKD